MEGEPFVISVSATGNPNIITYTWTRDGLPLSSSGKRITARGPTLNITKLERYDAGTYTCEAINEEGTTFYPLNLTVQCERKFLLFFPLSLLLLSSLKIAFLNITTITTIINPLSSPHPPIKGTPIFFFPRFTPTSILIYARAFVCVSLSKGYYFFSFIFFFRLRSGEDFTNVNVRYRISTWNRG